MTLCTHLPPTRALDISRIDGASYIQREKQQILISYPDKNLGYSPPSRAMTFHTKSYHGSYQLFGCTHTGHSALPHFVAFDCPLGAFSPPDMGA